MAQRQGGDRPRSERARSQADRAEPSEPRVGEIFRRARQHRGWSLRDVERRTGIPNPHLSQIERGQIRRPDVEILWRLSELYALDFARIATWLGHLDRPGAASDPGLLVVALRALSNLDPDAQVEAIRYIERLAEEGRRRGNER
jgi:transcriptional regulator with XRE-family HTH domain